MPNFHYVFREVRSNLMTHIMGDWGCGDLLFQARVQRVALNAGRSPAQSSKQLLPGQLWGLQPAKHTFCLCKQCGVPPEDQFLAERIFWFLSMLLPPWPLHESYLLSVIEKGWAGQSKSLTFSWKSFLCPSGLVKFGQAFLLPFGPWQITHLFRFRMGKRKGTIVPPAAEKQKAQGSGAAGWASSRHFCLDHVQIWLENHPVQK